MFDDKIATKCCNKFLEYNTLLKVKVSFIALCRKCCYVAFFNVPFQRWISRLLLLGFPMGGGGGTGSLEIFRVVMCRWDTGTPSLYSWFSWILEIFWNKVWRAIKTFNKYAIDMHNWLISKENDEVLKCSFVS